MTRLTLDRLAFASRCFAGAGTAAGPRGRSSGGSVDFVDYRDYAPGDDPRHVDWGVRDRTGKLVVRRFHADADLAIYGLLDESASMGLGRPSKIELAREIASVLARIAFRDHHPMGLGRFSSELVSLVPPSRLREQLARIDASLQQAAPRGASSFRRPFEELASRARRRGTVVVLSDFLAPRGFRYGLATLAGAGFQLCALQILSDEELHPDVDGPMELVDVEAAEPRAARSRLRVDAAALPRYRARLELESASLRALCLERGGVYCRLTSSTPLSRALGALVEAGLLELRRG